MAHSGDVPLPHFSVSNVLNTPTVHPDTRNGPPSHWHGHTYATMTAQTPASFQKPLADTNYQNQGYRGHDGRGPDGPVNPAEQYQFSLRPVMNTTSQPIPVDPILLRDDREHSAFIHPKHKVERDHRPRSKKHDGRAKPSRKPKKGKGKAKARAGSSDSESDVDDTRGKTRPGRGGAPNYNKADKDVLFDTVEELLPTGEKGWKSVGVMYNAKALSLGRPERTASSWKTKYQSYTKLKKPTGEAECPPEVKRAHEIEDLINSKAGTREVDDDSELEDESDDSDDSDIPKVVEPVRAAVARRAASPPLRRSRAPPADAINTIVRSLDPAALRVRDEARAHHSFERTQLMTLSAQLDSLCAQLSTLQQENSDLKRDRDRSEMERTWAMRLEAAVRGRSHGRSRSPPDRRRGRRRGRTSFGERDGLQRAGGKVRVEHKYPDGGAVTYWETDASSDATDFDHRPKKKQRHRSPTPYERRTPSPSPRRRRPISRRRTPTPGPSRLPFTPNLTSDTLVSGNAVELVVTPRRGGAPLGLIISPAIQRN
ncbi:hypothetical protein K438DRAFT_1963721 [Mycena galopus ATCC 62051]|nr:hypothetical protein K438DRAFT_1963721 [Mycena galopus ATCC 62051]